MRKATERSDVNSDAFTVGVIVGLLASVGLLLTVGVVVVLAIEDRGERRARLAAETEGELLAEAETIEGKAIHAVT